MRVTQEKILIGLGIWLFILPFTGFPQSWKTWLTAITGLVVVYLAALLLKRMHDREGARARETRTETFTETSDNAFTS